MKKITVYILLLLLLSSICSCLDDKNNYDYTPINELKGTISNIEKNYSVGIDEDLVITPTFEFTIDKTDPDVSYEWRLDGELLNVKAPSYTFNSHKIGLFELTFSVIDNKTGVKYSASTEPFYYIYISVANKAAPKAPQSWDFSLMTRLVPRRSSRVFTRPLF